MFLGILGGGKMLTKRRQEFLEAIKELYQKTGEPVHYQDVADALGVSKWTAYDFVKLLEKNNFVHITYVTEQDGSQVGRSRIGITPVELGVNSVDEALVRSKMEELLNLIRKRTATIQQNNIEELVNEAKNSSIPELTYLYIITIIIFVLKSRSKIGVLSWLQPFITVINPEIGMVAGLGLVIGLLLNSGLGQEAKSIIEPLQIQLKKMQSSLYEITDEQRNRLARFWQQALKAGGLI